MTDTGTGVDALGIFLSGGASNTDPAASLGGVPSTTQVRGMGPLLTDPIPAIDISNVYPACGEGDGTFAINADGDVVFTPPGGSPGTPVAVAEGESKVVAGADPNAAVVLTRDADLLMEGISTAKLVYPMNGVLSMSNVASADRIAGITTYRAVMLSPLGAAGVASIRLWMPAVAGAQAVFSLATEALVGGSIQTIADETTAPTGLTWVTPTVEASALLIPSISAGASLGLWIRRVFPAAGIVAPQEDFKLAIKYLGV